MGEKEREGGKENEKKRGRKRERGTGEVVVKINILR